MLEIKDLHVNYGAVHALNGISLTVNDGEIVSLIGANGAGKTTTLRTITGLEKAASGTVTFEGHDLTKTTPSKIISLKLAHVPEGRHIFPQMTVEENLEMGAYADRVGMAETMANVYARFLRLKERRRQLAGTLSGGERQRVYLAMILAQNTPIALLDEPTAHMDQVYEAAFLRQLRSIKQQRKKTFLVILHDLTLAAEYADDLVVLDGGEVVFAGTKEACLDAGIIEKTFGVRCYRFCRDGAEKIFFSAE